MHQLPQQQGLRLRFYYETCNSDASTSTTTRITTGKITLRSMLSDASTSTTTRITTFNEFCITLINSLVMHQLPQQQGLRPWTTIDYFAFVRVMHQLPQQQGLRHRFLLDISASDASTSTTTRITTRFDLHEFHRDASTSTTTRITTYVRLAHIYILLIVMHQLPQQQGLRPLRYDMDNYSAIT